MFGLVRPTASFILALLILLFFIRPSLDEVRTLSAESNQYGEVLSSATEFNNLLDRLYSRQASFSALERARLDTLVPEKIDEIRAVVDLEALAEQHDLTFEEITTELVSIEDVFADDLDDVDNTPETGTIADRLVSREINFTVVGSYESFRAFLRDVERSLVMMEIAKIEFDAAEESQTASIAVPGGANYHVAVRLFGLAPITSE